MAHKEHPYLSSLCPRRTLCPPETTNQERFIRVSTHPRPKGARLSAYVNEAVFTKLPYRKTGLTGMDLVRLGLERSRSAAEALSVVTGLLEEYGQGGNCSRSGKLYYHNSFIIADPNEAWVLETAGPYWVAEKVKSVRSISNALTIHSRWDKVSRSLLEYLEKKHLEKEELDFSGHFSDFLYTRIAKGVERQRFTQSFLEKNAGRLDFEKISSLMRSHAGDEGYSPARGSMRDICMHAGGLTRPSQTAGSVIAFLYEKTPIIFATGTSSPCISLYKPVFIESGLPDLGPSPTDSYDPQAFWWIHEELHRKLLASYPRYAAQIFGEIKEVEEQLVREAIKLRREYLAGTASREALYALTERAFKEGLRLDRTWAKIVEKSRSLNPLFNFYWMQMNKKARLHLS
ncbi:MAG: C69 family dipeptidase [Infirmifilum sp.]